MINEITCGDCMELMTWVDDNSVDLTLTDIPYDVINRSSNGLRSLNKGAADQSTFNLKEFLDEVVRVTKGSIYIFCSTEQVSFIRSFLVAKGLTTRLCIWEKTNPSPMNGQHVWLSGVECCVYGKKKNATFNAHCKNTVWRYPTVKSKRHPTEKPLALFQYLIEVSSHTSDIVFDPCSGAGTAALAAKSLGRKFIAFELDSKFAHISRIRLEKAA